MGQGFPSQRLGINLSAGTGLAQTGTVVLSNSNGVTFGMTLSASSYIVTASVNAGGAAISAGTTQLTGGTAVFSNSNGISFGVNGQTVTAVFGISAGTTVATGGSGVVFGNANGISFGANGGTITAQLPTVRFWEAPGGIAGTNSMAPSTTASNISFQRFSVPFGLSATQIDFLRSLIVPGSTTGAYSLSCCVYTFSLSTASSVSSASTNVLWTSGTAASAATTNYGGQSGFRWRSITFATWNLTPGEYLLAVAGSFVGVAGSTGSITFAGKSQVPIVGPIANTGNYSQYFGDAIFSVGSAAFPASVHISALNQTGTAPPPTGQPYFRLIGSG
jgi:hypothetical protein